MSERASMRTRSSSGKDASESDIDILQGTTGADWGYKLISLYTIHSAGRKKKGRSSESPIPNRAGATVNLTTANVSTR